MLISLRRANTVMRMVLLGYDLIQLVQVFHYHPIVGTEGVVLLKIIEQDSIFFHITLIGFQHFFLGHIGDRRKTGDPPDLGIHLGDLLLGKILADVHHRLVLLAQIFHQAVHIGAEQGGHTHQNQAGGQHAHAGQGHQPVGNQAVEALLGKITKTGASHPFTPCLLTASPTTVPWSMVMIRLEKR